MSDLQTQWDVVIVGAGFFGCRLALHLRGLEPDARILVVDQAPDILTRASTNNQARVHAGYHYPRSVTTAFRSFKNVPRFREEFRPAIVDSFRMVYGIARRFSKVSGYQFLKLYQSFGAPIKEAPHAVAKLFNPELIEATFSVEEFAFDVDALKRIFREKLERNRIEIKLECDIHRISQASNEELELHISDGGALRARKVFVCTYSQINHLLQRSELEVLPLKHELTEMALLDVPDPLRGLGITIMDGPFFSVMPFPSLHLHSLSHVRYTPHSSWVDSNEYDAEKSALCRRIDEGKIESRAVYMMKDASRYVPSLRSADYVQSLLEVKTVLQQNEVDDGRPILFRANYGLKNLYVILGAKIDNIYDVLDVVDSHQSASSKSSSAP